ncbi:hypothetical protein VNI00_004430 [Paramarasmius palmivorus]|uniref:Syndecan n=1 Tax=Paramarasmius palmivorus TaxID=297713 RepID=A0AAW0DKN1_9AGAR
MNLSSIITFAIWLLFLGRGFEVAALQSFQGRNAENVNWSVEDKVGFPQVVEGEVGDPGSTGDTRLAVPFRSSQTPAGVRRNFDSRDDDSDSDSDSDDDDDDQKGDSKGNGGDHGGGNTGNHQGQTKTDDHQHTAVSNTQTQTASTMSPTSLQTSTSTSTSASSTASAAQASSESLISITKKPWFIAVNATLFSLAAIGLIVGGIIAAKKHRRRQAQVRFEEMYEYVRGTFGHGRNGNHGGYRLFDQEDRV